MQHNAADAAIAHQRIASISKHGDREIAGTAGFQYISHLLCAAWGDEKIRRAACSEGSIFPHGSIFSIGDARLLQPTAHFFLLLIFHIPILHETFLYNKRPG